MIGVDIATLVLEVDATRVDKATASLIKLTEAGERAESGEAKRARSSKSATESLKEQTSATTAQAAASRAYGQDVARMLRSLESQGVSTNSILGLSEQELIGFMERRQRVMLRSAEMTGTLSIKQGEAVEKLTAATERLAAANTRAFKQAMTEQRMREIGETEKLTAATERLAAANTRAFKQAMTEQRMREIGLRDKADAKEAFDASPAGIYKAAGVKDPRLIADEVESVRKAQERLRQEYAAGDITQQAYAKTQDDLHKRMNLLTEGNVRHRGVIRQTAAAMASLAFEAAGAAFLVLSVGRALTAPALVGVKLQMKLEDINLAMGAILVTMGRIGDRNLRLPEALTVASQVTKELLADSVKYGVNVAALADTIRSITAQGLAAGMNLKEIQEIATVGTIAVKTIGLDAKQSVQEIRDLVAGGIQAASSTLANTIGVRDSDVAAWRKAGIVYDELMSRLKGYMSTAELSTKTMSGAIENLKTKFAILMMDENGFKGLTQAIISVGDYIGKIDPITKKFELNPSVKTDVDAYWETLKSIGAVLRGIGTIGGALLPIFGPIVSITANTVSSVSYLVVAAIDGVSTLLEMTKKALGGDLAGAMAARSAWAERDTEKFNRYAESIVSADAMLRMIIGTKKGSPQETEKKGVDASSITGGAQMALAVESKFWDQYVGVTRTGLERNHALTMKRFDEGAKVLAANRRQEFIGTEAQTKAHYEALAEEEEKFRLARDGAIKKHKEALASLGTKVNLSSEGPSAISKLITDLEATAAQAGRTATELEKVNATLLKSEYKAATSDQREYARSLAATEDLRQVSVKYSEELVRLGDAESSSLQSRLDAQIKHNLSLGETRVVSNELLAVKEDLLAVSMLQQASDIEAANQGGSAINAANLAYARKLQDDAKRTQELSRQYRITSEKEIGIAAEKAAAAAERDWAKSVGTIEKEFHKAWLTIGDKGVSMWETLTNSFKRMFKTTVLEYIYRELAKPIVLSVIASVAGVIGASGMAQGAVKEGGSNLLASAGTSAAGSWLGSAVTSAGNFAAGASAGIQGGISAAQGVAAGTGPGSAAAIGSYAGAALPIIAAAVATYYVAKKINDGKRIDTGRLGDLAPGFGTALNKFTALPALFGMGPRKYEATKLVGQFDDAGFEGDLQTRWREKGGVFRSDDTGTDITALTDLQKGAFGAIAGGTKQAFDSLITISGEAARSLDDWSFAVNHEIKTQEQQTALVKEVADSMGERLIPELEGFRKEGESLADTAIRLRDEFYLTDKLVQILGKDTISAFGAIGLASAGARDRLVEVAGGMSSLSSLTQDYYDNFFSAEEKLTNDTKSLVVAFGQLGISVPKSKDAFKSLVEAQDLSTDAGQRMFVSLLTLAPTFAGVIDTTYELANVTGRAVEKRRLEISLMEASGNASGALAAKRADELSSLDASLRPLQEQIYAQQDLTSVYDRVSTSLKNMKLQTQDAFSTAFEYTKYLRKADLAGIQGAKDALASPETTFTPGDPGVQAQVTLLAAIEKLRADMQAGNIASVETLLAMAKAITKWDGDGMPQPRTY